MECAFHPGKNSVGYCKKCARFGCEECLVQVAMRTGPVGKSSKATEVLICRECLGKVRPDLALPKVEKEPAKKSARSAQPRRSIKRAAKVLGVAAALTVVILAVAAGVIFLPQMNLSRQSLSAEEVADEVLDALAAGNRKEFLVCVDVTAFVCRMDSTGLTRRDYNRADRKMRKKLEVSHTDFLIDDLFISDNLRKKYQVVKADIKGDTASIVVRPWIHCGKKLYKRLLLEKSKGKWSVIGLTSPDY